MGDVSEPPGSAPDPMAKIRSAIARSTAPVCPTADLPLRQSLAGGSGSFLVHADDGKRYWCKAIENGQSSRVPLNEQIVGRLGRRIGAAVCDVSLIKIPPDLAGWEFRPGRTLTAGYAHGSLAVDPAVETRQVAHPSDDDNPTRLASLAILADWCWASDAQWLYAPAEENRYFSHDHGHYFPGGPNWTIAHLQANGPTTRPGVPLLAVSPERVVSVLGELANLNADRIADLLGGLPAEWPVTDDELVEMVWFLERRRVAVLGRFGSILTSAAGGAAP